MFIAIDICEYWPVQRLKLSIVLYEVYTWPLTAIVNACLPLRFCTRWQWSDFDMLFSLQQLIVA